MAIYKGCGIDADGNPTDIELTVDYAQGETLNEILPLALLDRLLSDMLQRIEILERRLDAGVYCEDDKAEDCDKGE